MKENEKNNKVIPFQTEGDCETKKEAEKRKRAIERLLKQAEKLDW